MKKIQIMIFGIIMAVTGAHSIESKGVCKAGEQWDYKKAKCVKMQKSKKSSSSKKQDSSQQAQQLIEAINDNDTTTVVSILSSQTKNSLSIIKTALDLTPDNSATVRCMDSNPNCGMSPVGKVLKDLEASVQAKDTIDEAMVNYLFAQYMSSQDSPKKSKPIMGGSSATYAPKTFEPSQSFNGKGLVGNYFSATQAATIHDPSGANKQSYTFEKVTEKTGYSEDEQAPDGLKFIGSFMSSPKCAPNMMCTQAMQVTSLYGIPAKKNLLNSSQIDDSQYYQQNEPRRSKAEPRYARPGRPTPTAGFRAPDDDAYMSKKTAAGGQIYY